MIVSLVKYICHIHSHKSALLVRSFRCVRFGFRLHDFDAYDNERRVRSIISRKASDTSFENVSSMLNTFNAPSLLTILLSLVFDVETASILYSPILAAFGIIVTYIFAKQLLHHHTSACMSAFLMSIVPSFLRNTTVGSFDGEALGMVVMILTFHLWIRSCQTGSLASVFGAVLSCYVIASSWTEGYVFTLHLISAHVVIRLLLSPKLSSIRNQGTIFLVSQLVCIIATSIDSMDSIISILTSLLLLQILSTHSSKNVFISVSLVLLSTLSSLYVSNNDYVNSLNPSYAATNMPLLFSSADHQPAIWSSYFQEMHILVFFIPVGLYLCTKKVFRTRRKCDNTRHDGFLFLILYSISSLYVSSCVLKAMLMFAPAACVLSSMAISILIRRHGSMMFVSSLDGLVIPDEDEDDEEDIGERKRRKLRKRREKVERKERKRNLEKEMFRKSKELSVVILIVIVGLLCFYVLHCVWIARHSFGTSSFVLRAKTRDDKYTYIKDFDESFDWIRQSTAEDALILSWRHYGHPIAALSNRKTVIDSSLQNITHAREVARIFASEEENAALMLRSWGVRYVYVVFGGLVAFRGDDLAEFRWMLRAAQLLPNVKLSREQYLNPRGVLRYDESAPDIMYDSLLYKLSYYRFGNTTTESGKPLGYDRARREEIGRKAFDLNHFKEVFTSSNWLVRVYEVMSNES